MAGLDRLYELMPAVYRERDEQEGFPLRALLRIVTAQADIVGNDIQRLWDNFFIETCDRWAIAYIGDLVSNNLLHDGSRSLAPDTARGLFPDLVGRDLRPGIAIRTRADVAKTIYYRRRKGTLPMLEELARDVTGWAAHAVEFFELLVWSQNLNHLRLFSAGCPDLRSVEAADRLNGPFDSFAHTVDVRPPRQYEGWHNIRNIGFFLWRLGSFRLENVRARVASQPWQYYFSVLGNPAPLFTRQRREGDEAGLATEVTVPGPIRPAAFFARPLDYYGDAASFLIVRDGAPVPPAQVRCQDLAVWRQPAAAVVGVDVRRGRMAFGPGFEPARGVDVYYHYGFSAALGGGPYDRTRWQVTPALADVRLTVHENGAAPDFPTVDDALADWVLAGRPNTIIEILDSRSYAVTQPIEPANDRWLVIQAASGVRPHLQPAGGEILVTGDHAGSELTFSGVLVEGGIHVTGNLGRLRVLHSTLVPGRALTEDGAPATTLPAVQVEALSATGATINAALRVEIAFSITGPLRIPAHAAGLWALDSIVDGVGTAAVAGPGALNPPGPPVTMERVTLFGRSFFRRIPMASEVVFTGVVEAVERQRGCVRFSHVPPGSKTPRRYRCQPALEIAIQIAAAEKRKGAPLTPAERAAVRAEVEARVVPSFTSEHYGLPGYAQLHLNCPVQIRTGAEDESEMGAFCHLKQPQRETNLRIRLEEYLPFGLEPGIIFVT